jgi:hypothetical protein
MKPLRIDPTIATKQRGAVLMVMLVIMIVGTAAFLVSALNSWSLKIEHERKNSEVLAQARDALIGYAASVQVDFSVCGMSGNNCARIGDLPCPDKTGNGIAANSCGDAGGSNQGLRLGRLPWKTLGLPDLRDASGEQLWYAVSNNYKEKNRTVCTSPGLAGCLNSDTQGTITVRGTDGSVINDGSTMSGVVAVVIAPGSVLTRQDGTTLQDRSPGGMNLSTNYLDIATIGTITEDNADFIDGDSTNGFIQGQVKDANGNVIVNDQILTITQDSIMQPVQKRVAAEVKQCLIGYAKVPQNKGRYPWASTVSSLSPPSYADKADYVFGRIPDIPFIDTKTKSGNAMTDVWTAECNINPVSGWWLNWKEMVFYGLADAYKPVDPITTPALNACNPAGACLKVSPPSAQANKQFAIIVAGKRMPGQLRSNDTQKGTFSNYLEAPNPTPAYTGIPGIPPIPTNFSQSFPSATFNDTVVFQ